VRGEKITVSAPFFNKVTLPLGLALLILSGICPLIAWRKATAKNFRRNFIYPVIGGLLSGVLALALGARQLKPLLFFSACGFVALTVVFEFYKGARARQTIKPTGFLTALKDLTFMNKRRYGGFIIHMGAALAFVGIIASSFYKVEEYFTVKAGEAFDVGGYTLVFQGLKERRDPEKEVMSAPVEVFKGGKKIDLLIPEKHYHHKSEQPMTEVSIRSRPREDLYLVLAGWDSAEQATIHVFINPMVQLIWIGIGVMACGGIFVIFPDKKPVAAVALKRKKEAVRDEAA
jgi:cytochrome c-type biogenesis protein CcmF